MPGMFPEIPGPSSGGTNPGATNFNQKLAAVTALATTGTTLLTQPAPAAGTYFITATMTTSGTGASADEVELVLEVAGSPVAATHTNAYPSVAGFTLTVSAVVTLNGAQAITVVGFAATPANAAISTSHSTNVATQLNGFRIN